MANATFNIEVKNLGKVLKDFERYGEKANEAAWFGIQRTTVEVLDEARRLVSKDTSTLARSIQITDKNREALSTTVSTNTEYAAVVEFGFFGFVEVDAHTRDIKQAFGKPIPLTTVQVDSHLRFMHRVAKPYMEPASQLGRRNITRNVNAELEALTL
jgi:phage gpG-like protein